MVDVSGNASPSLGLMAGAALVYRHRRFTAGMRYEIDRFEFPAQAGIQRAEQFAILQFSIGLLF